MAEDKKPGEDPLPEGVHKLDEIKIQWDTEPPPVYSDFASVSHRVLDFSMLFCALTQQEGELNPDGKRIGKARIVASVKMNPQVFFALVKAMTDNWNKWAHSADPRNPVFELKAEQPQREDDSAKTS